MRIGLYIPDQSNQRLQSTIAYAINLKLIPFPSLLYLGSTFFLAAIPISYKKVTSDCTQDIVT